MNLKRRIQQHFKDDEPSPDVVHELATICRAVIVEELAARGRRGGRARAKSLSAARRRQIARKARAAR